MRNKKVYIVYRGRYKEWENEFPEHACDLMDPFNPPAPKPPYKFGGAYAHLSQARAACWNQEHRTCIVEMRSTNDQTNMFRNMEIIPHLSSK